MAADLKSLLDHLSIDGQVHVIGHDIGGMIAWAFAARYPERTASLVWGECPLPGTQVMHEDRTTHSVQQFHFIFHSVPDLPEALVAGREEVYLNHFFTKIGYKLNAITKDDLDHYVHMYRQPGAMRAAFNAYRTFPQDGEENQGWIAEQGKCKVRSLGLSGARSRYVELAAGMMREAHEDGTFSTAQVPEANHYIAEENPDGFIEEVLRFIERR
jgi:pimeloyl-ACP methyl ester carboxylesterase